MGGTFAPINDNYIVGHDSSTSLTSPIIDFRKPLSSLCYQMRWTENVLGSFVWEASIFPDPYNWEQLVSCEEVKFSTGDYLETLSNIVSIPNIWLTVGFIRFRWEPLAGSVGTIDVAIRIVPV